MFPQEISHIGRINFAGATALKIHNWPLRRIFAYFSKFKKKLAFILLCIVVAAVARTLVPLILRNIIDHQIVAYEAYRLALSVVLLISLTLGAALVGVAENHVNTSVTQNIIMNLRQDLYERLQESSLQKLANTATGDLLSRCTNDLTGAQEVLTRSFALSTANIVTVLATCVIMFYLDAWLATFTLAILPLFVLPVRRIGKLRQTVKHAVQERLSLVTSLFEEATRVQTVVLTRSYNFTGQQRRHYRDVTDEVRKLECRNHFIGRCFLLLLSTASPVGVALLFWYGIPKVAHGDLTLGTLIAFSAYLGRIYAPVSQLLNVQIDFLASIALFQRIFEVFDHYGKPNRQTKGKRNIQLTQGSIAVRNVSFKYDGQCWGIKDVCLDINPGEIVALVGPSGAGKTTLAYLLAALYEPNHGSISIDGYSIFDLDEKSLRRSVVLVTEDNCLLDATIKDNLLLGNELASEDDIVKACKEVGMHDHITALPTGYESWLHQGGAQLSAGQKRRLMLARAMIKNPLILILDEVTSSLDPMTQDSINDVLKALFAQRSGLIISHHLPTILLADRILVIENGRIVQEGAHEKLVREGGLYARLFFSYPYNGRDNGREIDFRNSRKHTGDRKE